MLKERASSLVFERTKPMKGKILIAHSNSRKKIIRKFTLRKVLLAHTKEHQETNLQDLKKFLRKKI